MLTDCLVALLPLSLPLHAPLAHFSAYQASSSLASMFDFDPEAYYPINDQPFSPTRPPRPQRPTRATFYRPSTPRPSHQNNHRPSNNHHYPRPTSPPYTRPTRPPATRPPVSHYRPKPEPVDFYPSYYNSRPEENEVEDTGGDRQGLGHLSTASMMLYPSSQSFISSHYDNDDGQCPFLLPPLSLLYVISSLAFPFAPLLTIILRKINIILTMDHKSNPVN